jgi:hypothetical protein
MGQLVLMPNYSCSAVRFPKIYITVERGIGIWSEESKFRRATSRKESQELMSKEILEMCTPHFARMTETPLH